MQARFSDLNELCKPETKAHKLSKKMLNPTSIEKSSVALANSCFHESTIFALRYYSSHGYPYFKETADFLQIIRDWFNVVNCKSKFVGQQKIDKRRDAVYFDNRHQLEFLQSFYEWLNEWSTLDNKRGFSKPPFHHAQVSSLSLIHLANYLLNRKKTFLCFFWSRTVRLYRRSIWMVTSAVWWELF